MRNRLPYQFALMSRFTSLAITISKLDLFFFKKRKFYS
uniref:Uncharacterized protein n=1 Tax=Rhizophora mucronata TaxID=61149 RepID=A0A2P2NMB9_RHIMU